MVNRTESQDERNSAGFEGVPEAIRGLGPSSRVPGTITVPGSKSLGLRALLCAGLARGTTTIKGLPASDDVLAGLAVLRASGVQLEALGAGAWRVHGRCPGDGMFWSAEGNPVRCGESGTLARLTTGIHAWCGKPGQGTRLEVSGSLLERTSGALFDCLGQSGVGFDFEGEADRWPFELQPTAPPEMVMLQCPQSSQELSAMLIAMAAHECGPRGRSVLVMGGLPSEPYARMTLDVLHQFSVQGAGTGAEWRVLGPLIAPQEDLHIEADASAAAVALAAGCLSGVEVSVPGFHEISSQGDLAILDYLSDFGCLAEKRGGDLVASGAPTLGVDLDLGDTPDLAPVIVALAGALSLRGGADAPHSRLCGLETLNGKECRRLEVLAAGLRDLGIQVEEGDDTLLIQGSLGLVEENLKPLVMDSHGDHRMAFTFALLGLVRPGLRVGDADCVAKSWPTFWADLGAQSPRP